MEYPEEITSAAMGLRLKGGQPLWLLWAEDGACLAAGHEEAGRGRRLVRASSSPP